MAILEKHIEARSKEFTKPCIKIFSEYNTVNLTDYLLSRGMFCVGNRGGVNCADGLIIYEVCRRSPKPFSYLDRSTQEMVHGMSSEDVYVRCTYKKYK